MTRDGDDGQGVPHHPEDVDDTVTVSCERCGREWDVGREMEAVGNRALEQFALDHRRHTGHFPDSVETWRADCRRCPEESAHLGERAARRWAETHARHTRHAVTVHHARDEETTLVEPDPRE
jgi:ribosomal protein L37E